MLSSLKNWNLIMIKLIHPKKYKKVIINTNGSIFYIENYKRNTILPLTIDTKTHPY